jgi:nucleotide-binding universal stress UspA family protein
MKTILVATDFSKIAQNAIDYAVEIAKLSKAKLILFHVYNVPVIPAEIPIALPMDEIEKETMLSLKKIETSIHLKHGKNLPIECKCVCGFPVEEINLFSKENKIDLIVVGMEGEGTGYLTERLIGSITTSLIKKAKCPVIAIDKRVKFKRIKKIALACDYEETHNKSALAPLKEFAHLFKSHIYVLNVVPELETAPAMNIAVAGIKLEHSLEDVDHSFHQTKNEDVIEGINDFVDTNKMDMIVMIPGMHTVLKDMFREPNTKRMAFHTKIPLLALHE